MRGESIGKRNKIKMGGVERGREQEGQPARAEPSCFARKGKRVGVSKQSWGKKRCCTITA